MYIIYNYSPPMPIKLRILVFGAWFLHESWQFCWLGCTQNTHIGWYAVEPQNDWELRWTSILECLTDGFELFLDVLLVSQQTQSSGISQTCFPNRSSMFGPLKKTINSANCFLTLYVFSWCKKTLSTKQLKFKKKNNECVNVCKCNMALRYNMATEVLKKLLEWRADLSRADASGKRLVPWPWRFC